MVKTERELREDICQIGRLVYQKGWVAANDGNITIRLDAEPHSGHAHRRMQGHDDRDDLIIVDMKGNKIAGPRRSVPARSRCTLTVYEMRPDISAWCTRIRRSPQASPRPGGR